MQDIDFYSGRSNHNYPPRFEGPDPEFYTRSSKSLVPDHERNQKRASRLLFLISALCIISFTTGLVIGIKVSGNSQRELIDRTTYSKMTDISKRVSTMINNEAGAQKESIYPRQTYPYVIRIGEEYQKDKTQEIAHYLSRRGHTIILSKNNSNFRVYVGPYKSNSEAENALQTIHSYKSDIIANAKVIQRL
ncbi:MAG: SPOR domain-containing protein [Spirochaetes bacterium]|nr:SPOR domain-containing protein [Spirochaetota bacterium]